MGNDGLCDNLLAYMRGEIAKGFWTNAVMTERDALRKALDEAVGLIYAQRGVIRAYGRVLGERDDPADDVLLKATICSECNQARPPLGTRIKCRLEDAICGTCGNVVAGPRPKIWMETPTEATPARVRCRCGQILPDPLRLGDRCECPCGCCYTAVEGGAG